MTSVHGLLLAAGAGRRMGRPKALVRDDAGQSWLIRSVQVLLDGGCTGVTVVLGAAADEAEQLLAGSDPGTVSVVRAMDWAGGMGASLRAGLASLDDPDRWLRCDERQRGVDRWLRCDERQRGASKPPDLTAVAALVHLVDLPDVGATVVRRILGQVDPGPRTLARASYDGLVGHPVLLGREHWAPVAEAAVGDRGARDYLARSEVEVVECGDLASGADVDRPPATGPTGPPDGLRPTSGQRGAP